MSDHCDCAACCQALLRKRAPRPVNTPLPPLARSDPPFRVRGFAMRMKLELYFSRELHAWSLLCEWRGRLSRARVSYAMFALYPVRVPL